MKLIYTALLAITVLSGCASTSQPTPEEIVAKVKAAIIKNEEERLDREIRELEYQQELMSYQLSLIKGYATGLCGTKGVHNYQPLRKNFMVLCKDGAYYLIPKTTIGE